MRIEIDNRHSRLRVDQRGLARHLRGMLSELERAGAGVDVSLVDDREIRSLNKQWRGVDAVTDVLSFALQDDDGDAGPFDHLGDIVISLDTAHRQAGQVREHASGSDAGRYRLRTEAFFLATHGLLHLLGYDHQDDEQTAVMEALEARFIAPLTTVDVHALDRTDHGLAGRHNA